jgi:transcriptional regulator with XRE-family HTH domain
MRPRRRTGGLEAVPSTPRRTTGVEALDTLIDGVHVGDNLVVLLGEGVPGGWVVERFTAAWEPARLVVVDAHGRHRGGRGTVLDWSVAAGPGAQQARATLAGADASIGVDGAFVVDSLSGLASAWGAQAALDLFMWACPRLYRRRSVALWLVDLAAHDEAFVRRLIEVTQVVVTVQVSRTDGGALILEVRKADGRGPGVLGRTVEARLAGGELVDVRAVGAERQGLGEMLRELRSRSGMGQADVARRAGISPSALSQAERGVRGVSAETLLRIWDALGVPRHPGHPADPGYRVHRRGSQRRVALTSGVAGRRLSDHPTATVWELAFAARASGRNPLFAVKATETVTVRRGMLRVDLAGGAEALHEGDTLVADSASVQAWSNPTDSVTEVLWIISG